MTEPEVRAWLVTEVTSFLDDASLRRFDASASDALRGALETAIAARRAWVPLSTLIEALSLADQCAGVGDLRLCWEIGRFTALHEPGAVKTFAAKVVKPRLIMTLATGLWGMHYRNAGRATTRIAGPSSVVVSIHDLPSPHKACCLAVGGWMQGVLELGRRNAIDVAETACRCSGAASCDYTLSWREAT